MSKYNNGDRVRWTGKHKFSDGTTFASEGLGQRVGSLGTFTGETDTGMAVVKWDNGGTGKGHYDDNLELVTAAAPTINAGTRVKVINPKLALAGRVGTVTKAVADNSAQFVVQLDNDVMGGRVFSITSLQAIVATDNGLTNPKDRAVAKLGEAQETKSKAERDIKDAKKELLDLGVIAERYAPGNVLVFDSERYEMRAKTSEPGQRLDKDLLRLELKKAGLSEGRVNRVLAAATVDNKPATSYIVTAK